MNVKLEHPDPLRDLFIRRLIWAFSWIGLLLSVLIWTPGLKFIPPGYVPSMAEWREEIGELDLDSLASLGQHYKDFACYDSAIIVFQEMARMHWDARDTTAYWFTVGEIADCIRNAGQFKTGEILAGRVLQEIEKREGSNSAAYAWATYYWADYLRIRGKWNESLEMLNTSLAIQKQFLPEEHLLFSKTYHNIGLIFSQTGEYETSSQNFVWALEKRSQSKSKDFSNLYKIYLSMGILKYKLGNYTNSRDFLFAALRNQLKYYPPTHIDLLYTYSNLGKLFRKQKDFHRAAFFLDQALAILSYNRMIDSIEHAQILNLKALLNKDLGNLPKAEQLLIFAVEIYRKQLGDDGPSLGGYYCNLGEVYKMQGFAKRALKFYQNGITLLSKKYQLGKTVLITILFDKFNLQHQINNKIDSSLLREISTSIKAYFTDNVELKTEYFLFQANLMLKMHKFSTAKLYCDSAIAINSKIYSAIDTLSFKNSKKGLNEGIKLFEIYCLRGEINYKLFLSRPPSSTSEKFAHEALRNFDYSLSLASQIRKVYTSENSMFWIGAQSVPVIEMAIKTCWSIHQRKPNSAYIEKALLYSEKSKYQILLDAIIKLRAKRKYFSKSDLESYINLFEERNILLSKLEVFTDRNIESKISILIRQALIENDFSIEKETKRLEKKYPRFFREVYTPYSYSANDYLSYSGRFSTTIVEYFLGTEEIFIFVVDSQKILLQPVQKDSTFEFKAMDFRQTVIDLNYEDFCKISFELQQYLIEPIRHELKTENLLLIPDNVIDYITFDVLLIKPPRYRSFTVIPDYLFQSYCLSYGYSFAIQHISVSDSLDESYSILAYAPIAFTRNTVIYGQYKTQTIKNIHAPSYKDYSNSRPSARPLKRGQNQTTKTSGG